MLENGAGENKTRKYFGTDGVRDIANKGFMTPEAALALGRAYTVFQKKSGIQNPNIAVGRDTRYSGPMLQSALMAGIAGAGGQAADLGVIPTPGVSYTISKGGFSGGAVISASHNPAEYNGIKFLDGEGFKLTDEDEFAIEEIFDSLCENSCSTYERPGTISDGTSFSQTYLDSLISLLDVIKDKSYPIAIDGANGAASDFIERIFKHWQGRVSISAHKPDGFNINDGVGVTHMSHISENTKKSGSLLGIAYDGDTDRVLLCDSAGRIIDGDIMLWVIGKWLARENKLGKGVVATVMSNMALEELLQRDGVKVFRCGVGDRYVLDCMRRENSLLGGEQSGHIIALDYANTGDGLSAGILFLKAVQELNEDVSTLIDRFDRYPQILINLKIQDKDTVMNSQILKDAVLEAERMLAGKGRLLLRPSGTEPLLRIFVEAKDAALMEETASMLEKTVKNIIKEDM